MCRVLLKNLRSSNATGCPAPSQQLGLAGVKPNNGQTGTCSFDFMA